MDRVVMFFEYEFGFVCVGGNVLKVNEVVVWGCSEEVGGGRVENYLFNFVVDIYIWVCEILGGLMGWGCIDW